MALFGRTLGRITTDKFVGGVCSGLAYSLGVPTWIVRLLTVLSAFCFGVTILLYVLLWFFMPRWASEPSDYGVRTSQPGVTRDTPTFSNDSTSSASDVL